MLIKALVQAGPTFALLGYVIWQQTTTLRAMVERNADMAGKLLESNLAMAAALRDLEQARAEQRQAHAEQILLTKMTLDKVAEYLHG